MAWFKNGYEKGDLTSRAYYGLALATGTGIPRNAALGGQLMNEAADAGNVDAMITLASLHQVGQVLPCDYMRAYLWTNIATSRGATGTGLHTLRDDLEK
ncbi:MAG: sel1 repeat family protein [Betaproteobacteria bacterium]|nr:sel1 repeat family protein [Betaproteobacteria bacterium]